jgi:mannose-6-phosphate isomerase-like protein (cupin superfamily)
MNLGHVTPHKSEGITEYTLLTPEQTVNRNAGLKLLIFDGDATLEVPESKNEFSYYLLAGRGSLAFPKHVGQSRYTIDPDTAMWIPAGKKHMIINKGEGPFRCLSAHCRTRPRHAANGRARILNLSHSQIHNLVGFISRTIFSPELLAISGASRTIGVDFETLTPHSTLDSHEHEEEILYMLRGRGFVKIGGKELQVRPGSTVYTPPHIIHSVHNTEDDNFQYLVYEFSP